MWSWSLTKMNADCKLIMKPGTSVMYSLIFWSILWWHMTSSQAQCSLLGTDTQVRCDIPNIRLSLTTVEQVNHYTDLSFFVVVGWMPSGMWCSVIWWISSNILQESVATLFRLEVEMEAVVSFKMYPFTKPYNINNCCLMYFFVHSSKSNMETSCLDLFFLVDPFV